MHVKNFCIVLILFVLASAFAYAQEQRTELTVEFRVNRTELDPRYSDNPTRVPELVSFLRQIDADSTLVIRSVTFCGAASPEGDYQYNKKLARGRMKTLETLVRSYVEIPDSIIAYDDSYILWGHLYDEVEKSDMSHKEAVLAILKQEPEIVGYYGNKRIDRRVLELQKLDGGKVWKEMLRRYFSPMRNACVVFVTFKHVPPAPPVVPAPVVEKVEALVDTVEAAVSDSAIIDTVPAPLPTPAPALEEWARRLYVKTNALGWALGISNVGLEADLCKHLSFHLPVYYSAWNYFSSTVKFRTFAVQPELRYWFSSGQNSGWFVGAHFGLAYYNLAVNGDYRIQDHNGTSPALGGGISAGWRMPFRVNKRWQVEFSLGAGVYDLHFDKFHNVPNGLRAATRRKTYVGVDNAAVTISYSFKVRKKGGSRR